VRKRYWLLAIILISTGAAVSGLVWLNKRGVVEAQQSGAEPGTLAAMAQQAIAAGEPVVVLLPPTVSHDEDLITLDDIFIKYNLVLADLVSKQVVADPSADYVFTWYKFRLVQNLNPQVTNTCSTCPEPPQPPSSLLSLQPGEFLVVSLHGSATINGVNFLGSDHFTEFQLQYAPAVGYTNRYLLAVRFFTSPPVANLAADKILTYAVSSGGGLESLYIYDSAFRDQFSARYHNNINEVLSAFGVAPTPTPTPTPSGCGATQQQNCLDQGGTWNSSTCSCQPAFDPCLKKPWLCE
jgi:hypothetical protein